MISRLIIRNGDDELHQSFLAKIFRQNRTKKLTNNNFMKLRNVLYFYTQKNLPKSDLYRMGLHSCSVFLAQA